MKAITYADAGYSQITDRTLPRIRQHFEKQNVEFKVYSEKLDPALDIYWNRLPMMLRELSGSQYLIWTDTDMVCQRDFDWQAYVEQRPDINIWVSSETKPHRPDVCCGFMILRACGWTFDLLQTWRFLGPMRDAKIGYYENWNRREQEAFNILWDWFDVTHSRVHRIPEDIISNPISKQACKDVSVMFHFWGKNYQQTAFKMMDAMEAGN